MDAPMTLADMLVQLGEMYGERMPFHRHLGIRIARLTEAEVKVEFDMREDLIGNFIRRSLHGGVISSVLDLTGGLIASVELLRQMEAASPEEITKRMARIGTIDLRVDYLRAGQGHTFTASGSVLRKGNKVAVIRTELYDEQDKLIAAGTGTYLVG